MSVVGRPQLRDQEQLFPVFAQPAPLLNKKRKKREGAIHLSRRLHVPWHGTALEEVPYLVLIVIVLGGVHHAVPKVIHCPRQHLLFATEQEGSVDLYRSNMSAPGGEPSPLSREMVPQRFCIGCRFDRCRVQ